MHNIKNASSSGATSNPLQLNLFYFDFVILNGKAHKHVNEIAAFINVHARVLICLSIIAACEIQPGKEDQGAGDRNV